MEEYLYGNIGHKEYLHAAADPGYFQDSRRLDRLMPILTYDGQKRHGELMASEHQCYWMLASDLNLPGESERLFFQVSGLDPYRSSIYAFGYMSDAEDRNLYGPNFIRLLQTDFGSFAQKLKQYQSSGLHRLEIGSLPQIPEQTLRPAEVDHEALCRIILGLLQDKRVILRLKGVGEEAMQQSRALLLSIYQRLPYEYRRRKGFLTGATDLQLQNMDQDIPVTIQLLLADGDCENSGFSIQEDSDYNMYLDLGHPDRIAPMTRERNGRRIAYVRLIDYLTGTEPEKLDGFFAFCKRVMEIKDANMPIAIANYIMLLDFYDPEDAADTTDRNGTELPNEKIRSWAANTYSSSIHEKVKRILYEQIAEMLPEERLIRYFEEAAVKFDDLARLGKLEAREKDLVTDVQYASGAVMDQNQALTLRMAEALLRNYPQPEAAAEKLVSRLAARFEALAYRDYPVLDAQHFTGEDLKKLPQWMPTEGTYDRLADRVRRRVYDSLQTRLDQIREAYEKEREKWSAWGLHQIGYWEASTGQGRARPIRELYDLLEECFLCRECLSSTGKDSWNAQIANVIVKACTSFKPMSVEEYGQAAADTVENRTFFLEKGGVFTENQERQLDFVIHTAAEVQRLGTGTWTSFAELFRRLDEIQHSGLAPAVVQELKGRAVRSCSEQVSPAAVLQEADSLCSRAAADETEQQMLRQLLAEPCSLWIIPEGDRLSVIRKKLSAIGKLAGAGLASDRVRFDPWDVESSCRELEKNIQQLSAYSGTGATIQLRSYRQKVWAARELRSNTELMYLLAFQAPGIDREILPVLARSRRNITAGDIRKLYIRGWPRADIIKGAGPETSAAWRNAVNAIFPPWPELGELKQVSVVEQGGTFWAAAVESVLVGLMSAVPASVLVLGGITSLMPYLLILAVLLAMVLCCLMVSLCLRGGERKCQRNVLYLTSLGLSFGVLATGILLLILLL